MTHRFDRPAFLRGVFSRVGRQDEAAIDLMGLGAGEGFAVPSGLPRPEKWVRRVRAPFFLRELLSTLAPGEAVRGGLSTTHDASRQRWQAVAAALLIVGRVGLAVHLIARQSEASAYASGMAREGGCDRGPLGGPAFRAGSAALHRHPASLNGLSALAGREPGTKAEANAAIPQLEADAQAAYGAGPRRLFVPYLMAASKRRWTARRPARPISITR